MELEVMSATVRGEIVERRVPCNGNAPRLGVRDRTPDLRIKSLTVDHNRAVLSVHTCRNGCHPCHPRHLWHRLDCHTDCHTDRLDPVLTTPRGQPSMRDRLLNQACRSTYLRPRRSGSGAVAVRLEPAWPGTGVDPSADWPGVAVSRAVLTRMAHQMSRFDARPAGIGVRHPTGLDHCRHDRNHNATIVFNSSRHVLRHDVNPGVIDTSEHADCRRRDR